MHVLLEAQVYSTEYKACVGMPNAKFGIVCSCQRWKRFCNQEEQEPLCFDCFMSSAGLDPELVGGYCTTLYFVCT